VVTTINFTVNRGALEVVMERLFDAPRSLVWKLWTDPNLIPQWWGPSRMKTTVDRMDMKPGGRWRFILENPDGSKIAFSGEYREIVPPERLLYTFNFEPIGPGHEVIEVVTFEEHEHKTKLTSKNIYQKLEDLEGMVQSGMEEGSNETMERFADLLKKHS